MPRTLCDQILPTIKSEAGRIGVFLAGDFYTVPALDRRGGSGDVTSVWKAFAEEFAWLVGVAGNHDTFGAEASQRPRFRDPVHFLDANCASVSGLTVAGISGIVGDPRRPWRKTEQEFEQFLVSLESIRPDVLLMHDGPDAPQFGYRGSFRIRSALTGLKKTLVIRGHAHWEHPLVELENGPQVLNVDARVVILGPKNVRSQANA